MIKANSETFIKCTFLYLMWIFTVSSIQRFKKRRIIAGKEFYNDFIIMRGYYKSVAIASAIRVLILKLQINNKILGRLESNVIFYSLNKLSDKILKFITTFFSQTICLCSHKNHIIDAT